MKIGNWVIFKYKEIKLGTLPVKELTILENNKYFSLKLFYFCKGEAQERYHTHAFTSYSFRIFGDYTEVILNDSYESTDLLRSRSRIIYIPKDRYHQITKSKGCCTLMCTGKWGNYYKEYFPAERLVIVSTHGRIPVSRYTV